METISDQTTQLYHHLERLTHLVRAEGWQIAKAHGLQPIQLQMLGFLNICNRYSNTPASVTEYFGLTKGTVSQSLNILEEQGLIRKEPDSGDKRVVHLVVTETGATLASAQLPPDLWRLALANLSENEQIAALHLLKRLLTLLQKAHNAPTFGICSTCSFHQMEGEDKFRCGLTGESLHFREIGLICREHNVI